MSNSEEISDSIVVISSLSDEFNEDNESIRVINENSSIESSNSVVAINEGNECFKLEVEIGKLKSQIDELKNENHVLKQNLDVSRHQSNSSQDEKKSCLNCDLVVKKYDESVKESDKLLSKLKEYEKELDECKSNAKETALICESAFRELIAGLEELIRQCEEGKIQKGKEGQRSIQIEAFQLLSNNLIKTYKSLKINEFGSKYEATLKGLIESLSGKMMINNNNKPKTSTKSSQTTTESSSTTGELIGQVINEGLNEFRQTTETCKEKLSQQKRMIQSLLNKINSSSNLPSLQQTDNSEQIESAEHLESTKETTQIQQPAETKQIAQIVSSIWLYHCPSCDVSIDPNQVSWEKFLLHKYTCGKSAVICTAML